MGLRFRKSFKIAPGVRFNVNKNSTSISFGGKGLRYTINSRGKRTASTGIPGTGLSYVSTSSAKRKNYKTQAYQSQQSLQARQRQLQKEQEMERARLEVALFENQCEIVKSIHQESDEDVDWQHILTSPPPYPPGEIGPKEKVANLVYNQYKPTFFQRLFRKDKKILAQLELEIVQAQMKDKADYREWEELVHLSERVMAGDIDTYFQVIDEMDPLGDLSEFGSGFEFSTDSPEYMEVEFDVHSQHVIPTEEKSLTKTGKLSTKQMTKTRYFELQQDYVCSCTLRIARDLFALLPLEMVIIHAYDEQISTQTGHEERQLILSIKIDRATLLSLNFDRIDCSDSMNNFPHHMDFRKTKGFNPVEKIEK